MVTEKKKILNEVIEVFMDLQKERGRAIPEKLTGNMNPFRCLEEFDSYTGLVATVRLCRAFGIQIEPGLNLCVFEENGIKKGRSFNQITEEIIRILEIKNQYD